MSAVTKSVINIELNLFGREAIRALSRNKMRSALSAIGIAIGIAAVVCVVAIGTAGSQIAERQMMSGNASVMSGRRLLRQVGYMVTGGGGVPVMVVTVLWRNGPRRWMMSLSLS